MGGEADLLKWKASKKISIVVCGLFSSELVNKEKSVTGKGN